MTATDRIALAGIIAIPIVISVAIAVALLWFVMPAVNDYVGKALAAESARQGRGYDIMVDFENDKVIRVYSDNAKPYLAELEAQGFVVTDMRHFEPLLKMQYEYTDVELHREAAQ